MGETIKRFGYNVDLEDELGRGAFGTVYKGTTDDGEEAAMKKVSKMEKKKASVESVRYHYFKENIEHVNIIKVFSVKSFKESMWIIMEYCNGGDLNDFFKNNDEVGTDKFQQKEGTTAMRDIASGLAFLHSRDVVHRDIKPANIIMKSNPDHPGSSFTAKLGDFGLSKILDPDDMTSAMSSDVGTMAFKAPEFWDRKPGERARYHRNVDIYATGLTFAAMLQARSGHNLVPRAVGPLKQSENSMPIGLIAYSRKKDVDLLGEEPRPIHTFFQPLIPRMTRNSPENRISAEATLRKICSIMDRFGQNVSMERDRK